MSRIEKLKTYLEKTPADSFLRHALGLEYLKLGEEADAKQAFMQVIAADPAYVGTYYQLGKLLEKMGEITEAESIYKQGIEAARLAGDNHARNELQNALDELEE